MRVISGLILSLALLPQAGAEERRPVGTSATPKLKLDQRAPAYAGAAAKATASSLLRRTARLGAALRAAQEARDAAAFWQANRDLLRAGVEAVDVADGLGRTQDRRIHAGQGAGRPAAKPRHDEIGGILARISDRLAPKKPRNVLVGPGEFPGHQELAGLDVSLSFDEKGGGVTWIAREGNRSETAHYDRNGDLTGFTHTVTEANHTEHTIGVVVTNPESGETEVEETTFVITDDGVAAGDTTSRPHSESDPPLEEEDLARSRTGEEVSGGDGRGWCNPISGQCYNAGIPVNGDRVRPSRDVTTTGGARLVFDPEILVINPDPTKAPGAALPAPLRDRRTPGARPPEADE